MLAVERHPAIPVLVTESLEEQLWQRLRDQWIANEIRNGFSASDKAKLLEQLSLFGLSADDIAVQLSTSVELVEAGLAVRRSAKAAEAIEKYPQLDMLQAAALAEFADDLAAKVEHWKGVYARLQADGRASTVGPGTVAKGDWVLLRHGWARVRRVNKKSVTVPNPVFPAPQPGQYQDIWTVAWHKLRDHKTTGDMDPPSSTPTPGVDRIALHSVHNGRHAATRDRSGTTAPRTT